MFILSSINLVVFIIYVYCNRHRLGFIEAYSFNWFFAFLSFEFFPWYLSAPIQIDAKVAYLTFFISTSLLLSFFSIIRISRVRNIADYIISHKQFDDASFFKTAYWLCLLFISFTLYHRYQTGSLVLGVDYQTDSGSLLSRIIDYILMTLGFNHTGYWFYMGLLSISFVIYNIERKKLYFIFSVIIMCFISAVTTQKTYFLFSLISIVVMFFYYNKGILKQSLVGLFFIGSGSAIILLLNNIRFIQKGNEGSIFDYFDLETVVWYISLRLDYASSAAVIINNHFISAIDYGIEVYKSLLFFVPKSFLFEGEIYGVKIAQMIAYSNNDKAGLSFIPYAHFYEMMGVGGVMLFSVVCALCYSYFSSMLSRSGKNLYLLYYLYMVPILYYTSLTAPLHENIYIFLRSSLSFVMFILICDFFYKLKIKMGFK